jgi:hypothetical protein
MPVCHPLTSLLIEKSQWTLPVCVLVGTGKNVAKVIKTNGFLMLEKMRIPNLLKILLFSNFLQHK